ncbi:MAG: gamma-glutamyltransferase [Oligoflexia bacterium]|nr:gamma-glutamyltransferase [Oligoflexia bacterium]
MLIFVRSVLVMASLGLVLLACSVPKSKNMASTSPPPLSPEVVPTSTPIPVVSLATSNEKFPVMLVPSASKGAEAVSKKLMIVSQNQLATEAGMMLASVGGNIVDVAVGVSFVLSVVRPQSTGIGGGGFMLYHLAKSTAVEALDFRERAPLLASADMFLSVEGRVLRNKSLDTIWGVAVPGMVAGLLDLHKKHGKLPLKRVMARAIAIAEKGFPVYPHLAKSIAIRREILDFYEGSRKIFLHGDGTPLQEGEVLVQKDLAKVLKEIAKRGRAGFYEGWVAKAILKESTQQGGILSKQDLEQYRPKYRQPVKGTYGKGGRYVIYSMSPPSSGGTHVIEILNMVEQDHLVKYGPHAPKTVHTVASAMQLVFADRAKYMGDSDFVSIPLAGLLSKSYAKDLRKRIPADKAIPQDDVYPGDPSSYVNLESNETNHFTIMDKDGGVITSTQTVNGPFGSGIVVTGAGFVLNNQMNDFTAKVGSSNYFGAIGGYNNTIAPGKRPLSSMSPTIVFDKEIKAPILALGTAAGTRILSCVALTILNYIEHGLSLYDSVAAVRYHHQWYPDEIRIDGPYLPESTVNALRELGHKLHFEDLECRVQAIAREVDEGDLSLSLHGVSDPRGEGDSSAKGM